MRKVEISLGLLCIVLASSLLFSAIQQVQAGQFSVNSGAIYGTEISCSVSYPDNFHFNESSLGNANSINVSLSIEVTFNNQSISAVNITAVYARLYPAEDNLTQITVSGYPPDTMQAYAYGNWYTTDEYPPETGWHFPTPLKIMRGQGEEKSGFGSIDQIPISKSGGMYFEGEKQAKLYLLVVFCFLDSNGQAIWTPTICGNSTKTGTATITPIISFGHYHWELFTDNGEAPQVTAYYPEAQQQPSFLTNPFFWVGVLATVIIVIVAIITVTRRRRTVQKTDKTKDLAP